ncbi:MAG TPA: ChaN family lipoprotein, partial [Myxococcales bacterium]|nr:ChaN family lipoprotein [Myxococcales bacterium]
MRPSAETLRLAAANDTPRDPHAELIALHQKLFERQRRLVELSTAPEGRELVRYRRRYQAFVRSYERAVPYEDVLRQAAAADVVYVGDYHTLRQAQRAFVKLADRLCERGRPPVLALEFVQGRYQRAVDRFLAGSLDEVELLEAIRYRRHQAFDVWPNFRPIFELARRRQLRIVAIDRPAGGPRSLRERDAFAARSLARAVKPGELALVLVGQLHLAPPHLPAAYERELARLGRPPARRLLLYQNCEEIYWRLERQGLEHQVEAVRIGDDALCLVNSSPLVCQQSYLDWVEATREGELLDSWAPAHHFREAALLLGRFLEVDLEPALDSVRVHAAGDLGFL